MGFWPRIYCFWASALHWALAPHLLHWPSASHRALALYRALALHLLLLGFSLALYCIGLRPASSFGPAFTAFWLRPYIYCFWDSAPHQASALHGALALHLLLLGLGTTFTALGFSLASSFGPASGFGLAFTASGTDPAFTTSGTGPAFIASSFGPALLHRASALYLLLFGFSPAFYCVGLRPRIGLQPCIYCFLVLAPHRASALYLLLLGFGPAFTALGFGAWGFSLASCFGPAFTTFWLQLHIGLRPRMGLRPYIYCFWALVLYQASAPHLLLSGFDTPHLLRFRLIIILKWIWI
ncbi:hypothetical protein CRG98_041370 [Punica granatum]|uniref:Uncharacterized protein n=1 Tax=Punica granatum TaxID=22663 RepID=A0A2I0I2N5_PUNGR|nr:hypothetical protein CRG98_041370 [Punica granatum]